MNRDLAEQNFLFTRKKFWEKSRTRTKVFRDYEIVYWNGYVRKFSEQESRNTEKITIFSPHHCVVIPRKPGKTRAVFNAEAKFKNKLLNDHQKVPIF